MKIAIVILNWNGEKLLRKFLPSVIEFSKQAEIFVVDNASTDGSIPFLETLPAVKILKNPYNMGFAKGYNYALRQIEADIFCLLNSDVEVTENWLVPIENCFKNTEISAVQPKILDFNHRNRFEYAGGAGGFIDKFGFPYCRGRIFDTIEEDFGQYDTEMNIFWASGACFFICSKDFFKINGFDEDFFAHQEEIDLCWRLHHLKKQIVFCPKSTVYHVGGATLPSENPQKIYLNFRNGLFMLLKNLPKKGIYGIIFVRMCLDGIAGIRFLLQGKWRFTKAIIVAHFDFYQNFLKFKKKRNKNHNPLYFNTLSIVWDYFIKKKKYFLLVK